MTLVDNLVSYYKLDESSGNASDSVGGNTLTNTGTVTYGTGKINNGANISSGKYFSSPDTDFSFGTGTAFSISFWFKTSSVSANQFILSNEQALPFTGYVFYINASVDQFEANFLNTYNSSRLDFRATTTTITTNTWYYITLTYDGTANTNNAAGFKVYINGTDQTLNVVTNTLTTNNFASSATMYFGARRYETEQYMTGMLDEIGIWSRALSAEEVSDLWNEGAGLSFPFLFAYISGLVKLNNSLIENAKIYCVDQTSNEVVDVLLSDENGFFKFEALDVDTKYHIAVEYEDNENKLYNAKSLYDIIPIEPS